MRVVITDRYECILREWKFRLTEPAEPGEAMSARARRRMRARKELSAKACGIRAEYRGGNWPNTTVPKAEFHIGDHQQLKKMLLGDDRLR